MTDTEMHVSTSTGLYSMTAFREFDPTVPEVESFAHLPEGWCYGSGGPISGGVLRNACFLLQIAHEHQLAKTEAFPGVEGEVMVSLYRANWHMDITVYQDSSCDILVEEGDREIVAAEGESYSQAAQTIGEFAKWSSSGVCTPATIAERKSGSRASLSTYHPMEAYPASEPNVFVSSGAAFVSI